MLEHKIVLVTGASSGIGRAIALRCARAGADLAITYRKNQAGAEATAQEIRSSDGGSRCIRTDISRREDIDALGQPPQGSLRIESTSGSTTPAPTFSPARPAGSPRLEKLDLVLVGRSSGNGPRLVGGGRPHARARVAGSSSTWRGIISSMGMKGENPGLYSAAKGGIASFSKSLARDVAPEIRVNILAPGFIETAFGEGADPEVPTEGDRDDARWDAGERRTTSPPRRCSWPRTMRRF